MNGFRPPLLGPPIQIRRDLPGDRVSRFPGGTRIDFGGIEMEVGRPPKAPPPPFRPPLPPPPRPPRRWDQPWVTRPVGGPSSEKAQLIAALRAQERAQRQQEQARARERAQQEAARRRRELERAREQALAVGRRLEKERQDQARQAEQARQRALREQKTLESRMARQNREQLRQRQERQRAGTWLGTALAAMVPPGIRRWATRRPLDDVMFGVQGPDLIFRQADRTAHQVKLAMEDFNFWVSQAAQAVTGALGGAGEYMLNVGMAQAAQQVGRLVAASGTRLPQLVGEAASSASPRSIDRVLLGCRDEAVRITRKLAQQDLSTGVQMTPQRWGEVADAVLKSLVQQARRQGLLPQSLRTAPPPLAISGTRLPRGGAIDVWDSATGIGWDLTTARVRSVAGHERYIGRVMPDGVRVRDVRPLVYRRE